jgi:hypothetical protein
LMVLTMAIYIYTYIIYIYIYIYTYTHIAEIVNALELDGLDDGCFHFLKALNSDV